MHLDSWWTGIPIQRTRTTHFAHLGLTLAHSQNWATGSYKPGSQVRRRRRPSACRTRRTGGTPPRNASSARLR
jgi:hypothetical protein